MLPRPRRRVDVEVVRARLRGLAAGTLAAAVAPAQPLDGDVALPEALEVPAPPRSVALRAVVVALGSAALTAWLVVRVVGGGAPAPLELVPGTPVPVGASGSASAPVPTGASNAGSITPEPVASGEIVVQVLGEVRTPGLVRLRAGSRVADALLAAGGLRPGGATGGLNLARLLADGEQVVVAHDAATGAAAPSSAGTASGSGGIVDLNAATLADLDTLPGVGPVMAARILDWRAAHGRFTSVDQLREVSGVGARTFERLKPHVRV